MPIGATTAVTVPSVVIKAAITIAVLTNGETSSVSTCDRTSEPVARRLSWAVNSADRNAAVPNVATPTAVPPAVPPSTSAAATSALAAATARTLLRCTVR